MSNPPVTPGPSVPPPPAPDKSDFNIGEEYGTARKNLPPVGILAICIGIVIVIAAAYTLTHRAHPQSSGSIDSVYAAPFPNQKLLLIAVNVTLENKEEKPMWIKSIQISSDVAGQKQSDDAMPAVDVQRYLTVLPDLKQHVSQIVTPEMKIAAGEKMSGTVLVSFPVTPEEFTGRKSITVTILPYDEVALVMTK